MTGRKVEDKVYYRHSGRPGHLKVTPLKRMVEKKVSLQRPFLMIGDWGNSSPSSVGYVTEE